MEKETRNKGMKVVEIPFYSSSSSSETEMSSSSLNPSAAAAAAAAGGGLTSQGSLAKNSCLCSPTTHAGSFRCRLHRTPVSLQRTKSMDSSSSLSSPVKDHSNSKPTTSTESTVVQAQ